MNLFVLLTATRDLENGSRALNDLDDLIAATTWSSNAYTAREIDRVLGDGDVVAGIARVAQLIASLDVPGIVLDHPPLYPEDSLGVDANNWITAEAVNAALRQLWEGDILSPQWRDYLLAHLEAVKPGLNYLVASVDAEVSHKNGFFNDGEAYIDNDAGIVRFEAGGQEYAYAVTILSQDVEEKYADIPLAQTLMQQIHAYFLATYDRAD
jgi:hypothetical protein